MDTDVLKWYEEKCKNIQFRNDLILDLIHNRDKGIADDGETRFHFKTPHSRIFKVTKKRGHLLPRGKFLCSTMDNYLALSSELISMKKYRAFGMLYADYHIVHDRNFNVEMKIASPNVLNKNKFYVELNQFYDQADFFRDSVIAETSMYNVEEVFTRKEDFLIFMTEKAYDEYVKYLLLSLFEFSDDEHYSNIIFYNHEENSKLDGVFLFDKESTSFNPMVAANCSVDYMKKALAVNRKYNNRRVFRTEEETFDERFEMLLSMIRRGVVPEKYVHFIEEIAGIDYGSIAKSIKQEMGIAVNDSQLEMYKYGCKRAEELLEKI